MATMKELSVSELERMLARKRSQLESLTRRRKGLEKKLEGVNRQIGQLGGGNGKQRTVVRKKVRRRPRNAKPLAAVVVEMLKKNKSGLSIDQLQTKVLATGYKSRSDDFRNVIYQCLYNNRKTIQHDSDSGIYKLA